MISQAKAAGYRNLDDIIANKETLQAGDKVYANNMDKTLAMYIIGEEPMEKGMRILGAHVDSPRIDLKQNPLYEDQELALFRYTLLRRSKEISVGDNSFGITRGCGKERRTAGSGCHWRG